MGRRRTTGWQVWVRMLCALALLAVGFAHRAPVATASTPTDPTIAYAAYVLPDGTLASLCETSDAKSADHKGPGQGNPGCEACRISASTVLPLPADTPGIPAGQPAERLTPGREAPSLPVIRTGNTRSRAPPSLLA